MSAEPRYRAHELVDLAAALFAGLGAPGDRARLVAELLVEADLMGHSTHGLALAPAYLADIEKGSMAVAGEPEVVREKGACLTWDGGRLCGVWLAARAVDEAAGRALRFGIGGVAVRNSHHIACLAVFLRRATERGLMVVLASSDPSVASVAPYGGTRAVFTPDPLAVGIPTGGDPILIDTSASVTTNGMSNRLAKEGRRFAHPWLLDAQGTPTDDPAVLAADPPGTILPAGGLDHGHKGYALALMIEALTQGLGGFGRAEAPAGWGASIYAQAIDPEAFAGLGAFARETGHIAELCRASPPRPGVEAVRLPGEAALARRRRALEEGVALYPGIMPGLEAWARRLGADVPGPL
jgi:LDH2 family malate/lactate/ureidoglycolate dehydrogenase